MAQEFIDRLLSENKVDSEPRQQCHICLSVLGTVSEEGIIEHAVRLTCTHVFGSICISTWLKDHNTCPCCRRKLYMESMPRYEVSVHENRSYYYNLMVRRLQLSGQTLSLAVHMAERLDEGATLQVINHRHQCVAALMIYIAASLMREARSLQQVSQASEIAEDHLSRFYRNLYPNRNRLVPTCFPEHFIRLNPTLVLGVWDLLPAPSDIEASTTVLEETDGRDPQSTDGSGAQRPVEESNGEAELLNNIGWADIQDLGIEFCQSMDFDEDMTDVTLDFIGEILALLPGRPFREIAASSALAAGHFIGRPVATTELASTGNVNLRSLQRTYEDIYIHRRDLITQDLIRRLCHLDLNRALQAVGAVSPGFNPSPDEPLAALNWPSSETFDREWSVD